MNILIEQMGFVDELSENKTVDNISRFTALNKE